MMLPACRAKVDARATRTEVVEVLRRSPGRYQETHRIQQRTYKSKTFAFWQDYGAMVDLLLLFIKEKRIGNWKLYLCTVIDMVSSLLAMDRHNYFHWL